jgi:hypothetical protein
MRLEASVPWARGIRATAFSVFEGKWGKGFINGDKFVKTVAKDLSRIK